ncbi:MAG TPA: right-handed parallel beta-helix repeat-containing protein [bacterium]|nr:right-handed parallel beta-helix repeat-containing protein [bacterium]
MTLMRLMLIIALAMAFTASFVEAVTVVVDPGGGGDYDNIPEAVFNAGADDTVLVMPGIYAVVAGGTPGWPIPLDGETPTILSDSGADVTTLEGDGSTAAFSVAEGANDARLSIQGFTFTLQTEVIHRDYPSYPGGPVRFTDNVVTGPGGLDAGNGAGSLIARNVFAGSGGAGITHGHSSGPESVIEDNEVSGYAYGIGAGETTIVRRNHVHDCTECGVVAYGPLTAYDNLIENCAYTGFMLDGTAYLEGNTITGNGTGIGWPGALFNTPAGYVRLNDIYGNATNIAVPLILGYSVEFDATVNWWGTDDPEEIAEGIYDCNDEWGGNCCVIFTPWCTAPTPGCDPTAVSQSHSWGVIKALYR